MANDVETEQIVFEDVPEGSPFQISSIVQNRGSIPLFWSQETSRLNIKPDIICMFLRANYGIKHNAYIFYAHTFHFFSVKEGSKL